MPALFGDCAADANGVIASIASTSAAITFCTCRTVSTSQLLRRNDVVLEIAGRIGLGPEADAAADRRSQHCVVLGEEIGIGGRAAAPRSRRGAERVLERELAIEPRFERGAVD